MHSVAFFISLSLALFCCITVIEANRSNTACTREYNPVCGTLKRTDGQRLQCTFANPCLLQVRRCTAKEHWIGKRGRCAVNSVECANILRRG